ncbi:MAG TPA: F0F1 ATP synthase subunit B [Candidatus Azoamicus sp. OHIO2]
MDINATLLGQMITFGIFVMFSLKFVWPMIQNIMEERKKKILDGLDAAKKGHEKLKQAEEKSHIYILEAKDKYNTIIMNATKQADKILDDARMGAISERDEIILSGRKQIEQELNKVKIELQKQVAELIIIGSEKILGKSIHADDHIDILNKFMKQL